MRQEQEQWWEMGAARTARAAEREREVEDVGSASVDSAALEGHAGLASFAQVSEEKGADERERTAGTADKTRLLKHKRIPSSLLLYRFPLSSPDVWA